MDLCLDVKETVRGGGGQVGERGSCASFPCHGILAGFQLHPDSLFVLDRRNVRVQLWEFTSLAEVLWTHPGTGEQPVLGTCGVLAGVVVGKALPKRSSELQRAVRGSAAHLSPL